LLAVARTKFRSRSVDTFEVAALDALNRKQFPNIVDAHTIENALRLDTVAKLADRRVRGGEPCDSIEHIRRGIGSSCAVEHVPPFAQHFLGVVEALSIITSQRLLEEGREPISQVRIERVCVQRNFAVEHIWCRVVITPYWQRTRGHLVQGDRCRVTLRIQVPPRRLTRSKKRIEVAGSTRLDILGRSSREREVK